MNIKCIVGVMLFAINFVPMVATATVFDIDATGEYIMGDSDTKIDARRMALEHAKRTAAEKAGSYIESTTIIKDSTLTKDEISSFTSAILQTTVISEDLKLLENKTTMFQIIIKSSVDTSVLEAKISELKGDTKRKAQLLKLQQENAVLIEKLDSLSKQYSPENITQINKIREQREELFTEIDKNNNAIRVTFAKGTLSLLAAKDKNNLDDAKAKIDKMMLLIKNGIKVSVGDPQIPNSGEMSDIIVPFSWYIDTETKVAIGYLLRDLCSYSEGDIGTRFMYCNPKDTLNWAQITSYMCSPKIGITITAGKHDEYFALKQECYEPRLLGSANFHISVPTEELGNITSIEAKVTMVKE